MRKGSRGARDRPGWGTLQLAGPSSPGPLSQGPSVEEPNRREEEGEEEKTERAMRGDGRRAKRGCMKSPCHLLRSQKTSRPDLRVSFSSARSPRPLGSLARKRLLKYTSVSVSAPRTAALTDRSRRRESIQYLNQGLRHAFEVRVLTSSVSHYCAAAVNVHWRGWGEWGGGGLFTVRDGERCLPLSPRVCRNDPTRRFFPLSLRGGGARCSALISQSPLFLERFLFAGIDSLSESRSCSYFQRAQLSGFQSHVAVGDVCSVKSDSGVSKRADCICGPPWQPRR